MRLVRIDTPALAKAWVHMPVSLYKNERNYIRPLDIEIELVFDPARNERFKQGEAERWLLQDENGTNIGRIAAFYQHVDLGHEPIHAGGIGFFECENNPEAAKALFEVAEDWLKSKGVNAIDAPINFGDRDKWWGLLVDGFIEPSYGMNYNLPYYKDLFEANGYQDYFKQFTYYTPVNAPVNGIVIGKAKRVSQDPNYTFRHLKKHEIMKFAEPFRQMYNKAWGNHSGIAEMTVEHAQAIVKELMPIMDPRLIWFGFYKGEPISFFIMLPDVNQAFKYLSGKFGLWEKIKLAYLLRTKVIKRILGIVYGVVPEHQGKGVETAMVYHAGVIVKDPNIMHYTDYEMNWIGDFNPKMMKVAVMVGGTIIKTHITYRKILDPAIPFERCPVMK